MGGGEGDCCCARKSKGFWVGPAWAAWTWGCGWCWICSILENRDRRSIIGDDCFETIVPKREYDFFPEVISLHFRQLLRFRVQYLSAHLCWCRTSSSMLRCSERAGPIEPRLPRLKERGGTTCLVRPLILFNPRSPLVRVFFLSCWRKALRPAERALESVRQCYYSDSSLWHSRCEKNLNRIKRSMLEFTILLLYLVRERCRRPGDPPGSWRRAGCPGRGGGGGRRGSEELLLAAELHLQPQRLDGLTSHP